VDRLDAQWKSARVVEADDERIICEFPEMGSRLRRLILFVESLTTLADGIESLRDTIPAPQALAEKTGIWEAAAHSLGAMFEPAAMRFTVARESMKVLVRPDWLLGGEANGLVIELHPGIEIASRLRGTWERFEQFESAHGSSGLRAVRIDNSHIRLELPVEATLEDAANRVLALLEIGKRLHGSRGAYR
jgi:hypothetical protein